jgi:hypothetical protein
MGLNNEQIHTQYLNEFIKPFHLKPAFEKIGKSLDELVGIITEPEYLEGGVSHYTMCDYLFLFNDRVCVPGELKGNRKQRRKATSQMKSGKYFAEQFLKYDVDVGLFVVYNIGEYQTHRIKL